MLSIAFISVQCQSHLLRGRLHWDGGWWFPPHQTLPFTRGHSAPLTEFFTKKTHTQTHACIIPLYTHPCVVCLCFCLCKITVVQVSTRQSNADRQVCKRTAKHLCSPQRSFLSYNWLCPAQHVALVTKTRSCSSSPLHLPEEQRGRWKVLSKMSRKVASSFKGPWMYMAHGFLC